MGMIIRVEAIFEDCVLQPVGDVPLYEGRRVTLTIARLVNELALGILRIAERKWRREKGPR